MQENNDVIKRQPVETRHWEVPSNMDAFTSGPKESLFTWEQLVRVVAKHKWLLLLVIGGVSLAIASTAFLMPDVYQPTARVEIDPLAGGIKTLHEIEAPASEGDQDYLETQVQILQSDGLAMRVIRGLHLDKNADLRREREVYGQQDRGAGVRSGVPNGQREASFFQEQLDLADLSAAEASALRAFHRKLSVNPIRGSRLVEVGFASHDARTAQMVTNALVTQFIDQNYKNRYVTTMEASEWLSAQLNDLRQKVSESNMRVANYQKRYGLVEADERDVPLAQLMSEVSRQMSDAQADRIQAEAYVRMIDLGQADTIPAVRDDVVYQNLLTHYADVRAQLAQAQTVYGDENANVKKLQGEANELAAQLEAERSRLVSRVRTSFAAARAREQMMIDSREQLRAQMGDASSHLVEYRTLKNEAMANAQLYNTLEARLKEAGIYAGLRSGNIRIVDMAPRLHSPTSPHRLLITSAGVLLSVILGIAVVFFRESLDNTVRIPDDIKTWIHLPSLAVLPTVAEFGADQPTGLAEGSQTISLGTVPNGKSADHPRVFWLRAQTAEAEAIRSLRAALAVSLDGLSPQVILVSSAATGEGKTTVALNLASVLAQLGKTCLVEGDLRHPTIESVLNVSSQAGLGEVLEGKASLRDALTAAPSVPGLTVLATKSLPKSPADLLASEQMRIVMSALQESFDYVVIDSPPLIPFSDARSLASLSDAVILVSRYGHTTRRAITRGAELLADAEAPLIGVVLNDMDIASPDYRYFNYGYSWGGGVGRNPYAKSGQLPPSSGADQGPSPEKSRGAHA